MKKAKIISFVMFFTILLTGCKKEYDHITGNSYAKLLGISSEVLNKDYSKLENSSNTYTLSQNQEYIISVSLLIGGGSTPLICSEGEIKYDENIFSLKRLFLNEEDENTYSDLNEDNNVPTFLALTYNYYALTILKEENSSITFSCSSYSSTLNISFE